MIQDYHPWYYTVILFSSVLLLRRSGRSEEWSKHGACRSQPTSRINLIQRFSTFQPCSEFPRSNLPTEAPPFRNSAQSYWSSSGGEHSGELYDERRRGCWPAFRDLFDHLANRWTLPSCTYLCSRRTRRILSWRACIIYPWRNLISTWGSWSLATGKN